MSLAATLAAGGGRPASYLPAVKCSDCGNEIEINELESHICANAGAGRGHTQNMSNPFTLRRFNAAGQQPPMAPSPLQQNQGPFGPPSQSMRPPPGRPSLPRINSDAANRPFLAPKQPMSPMATPTSLAPGARSESRNGGRPGPLRSATSPARALFDFRPPSPELSANLDCAFPPFPTAATSGRRPSTSQGRRTPNSERAPSRGPSRLDRVRNAEPEPFDLGLPSPKITGPESVMQRMNTMKSGPFDGQRKGSAESRLGTPGRTLPSEPAAKEVPRRSSTSSSNYSQGRPSFPNANTKAPPPRPERPLDEDLSPRFLDSFSDEPSPLRPADDMSDFTPFPERSNTYPLRENNEDQHSLTRMRSEPAFGGPGQRPPLPHATASAPTAGIQIHTIPPRGDSRAGTRMDFRIQDAPPVPRPVQQHGQGSTHTPSESGSSTASGTNSAPTNNSNELSPISSVTSNEETLSALTFDSVAPLRKQSVPSVDPIPSSHQEPGMRAEQPAVKSPPRNFARPGMPINAPRKLDDVFLAPMESPMDPALQQMQSRSEPTYEPWGPPPPQARPIPTRSQTATGPLPTEREPYPAALSISKSPPPIDLMSRSAPPISRVRTPSNADSQFSVGSGPDMRTASPNAALRPPPIPEEPQIRKPVRRNTNAKPMCRGCGLMIEGKSVKAADGRLTGRWHKACFVCKSCQNPFTTADFYVIDNQPYCEQHYHEQNGSLCQGCYRGIEGQYLETSSASRFGGSIERKYHPRCFTCWECRQVLSNDYFEIKGYVYCERHALAAMRAQARMGAGAPSGLGPPDRRGLMAERRTTRLINPIMA